MAESSSNRSDHTLVLLFSGGMDSYIAYKLLQPDICLYIRLGHRYEWKELEAIRALEKVDIGLRVTVDKRLSLTDIEQPSGLIPLRNMFLLAIASFYGDRLILGKIKGNSSYDKSDSFRRQFQQLLTTLHKDTDEKLHKRVEILFPLSAYTKTRLIKKYLQKYPAEMLKYTTSCYSATEGHCGKCIACFRRWVACYLNNVEEAFSTPPWEAYKELLNGSQVNLRNFLVSLPVNYNAFRALRLKQQELK